MVAEPDTEDGIFCPAAWLYHRVQFVADHFIRGLALYIVKMFVIRGRENLPLFR